MLTFCLQSLTLKKVKPDKVREVFSPEKLGEVSKTAMLANSIFKFSHLTNHIFHFYVTHDVQYIQIQHFTTTTIYIYYFEIPKTIFFHKKQV